MEYSDYLRELRATRTDLAAELEGYRGLSGVMGWMRGRGLALGSVEIVQQDECNLDFIVPLAPDGERLVFGIT